MWLCARCCTIGWTMLVNPTNEVIKSTMGPCCKHYKILLLVYPDCPLAQPRCVWSHKLLPWYKFCVLIVHTESVHKRTQILCLGIIHLLLKNMDWAKDKQPFFYFKRTILFVQSENVIWMFCVLLFKLIVEFDQVWTHATNKVAGIRTLPPIYNLVFTKTVSFILFI
jgi:hypothetical protein